MLSNLALSPLKFYPTVDAAPTSSVLATSSAPPAEQRKLPERPLARFMIYGSVTVSYEFILGHTLEFLKVCLNMFVLKEDIEKKS